MTRIYFVRHAQSDHGWQDDRTRPLTREGMEDTAVVRDFFRDKGIDAFYCSPYRRSRDTIASAAAEYGMEIQMDERLREREVGDEGNVYDLFRKRWADHDYHEPGGESIAMVQSRNVAAVQDILKANPGKNLVVGTHGTALSSILNHYDPAFGGEDFIRILDWMPYIIALDFEGEQLVGKQEHLHIYKEYIPL